MNEPSLAPDLARAVLEHDSWSPAVVRMLAEEVIRLSAHPTMSMSQFASKEDYEAARATPRTDAVLPLGAAKNPEMPHIAIELAGLCRQLERELEICRDAHMANCLAADTLRTEIRALRDELAQSKLPVIGECEDCGHKIVTPLKRLA